MSVVDLYAFYQTLKDLLNDTHGIQNALHQLATEHGLDPENDFSFSQRQSAENPRGFEQVNKFKQVQNWFVGLLNDNFLAMERPNNFNLEFQVKRAFNHYQE